MRDLSPKPKQDLQERTWLLSLRADDRTALEAIYTAYFQPLWQFAARSVGPETAEDTVHDVFLALWQRRSMLDPDTRLAPYLFTAVRRRVIDTIRHIRVESTIEQSLVNAATLTPIPTPALSAPPLAPDEAASLHELTATLERLLSELPERNRTIMTLRWLHGMTYEEIADVLGISLDAAKKQGRRLQRLLTPLLAQFRDDTKGEAGG